MQKSIDLSFTKFRNKILKVSDKRIHKVNNSLGVYDAFKYYRKHRPKEAKYVLNESQFFAIIRQINKLLAEELIKGNDIILPNRLGRLELRKYNANITLKEGKIHTNLPIDWDRTLKLWYNDKESYDNKVLVRKEETELYKIYYNKSKANYNNKSFYEFNVNREIKKKLKNNIKEGLIDAFLIK